MPYDVTLAQINANAGGFGTTLGAMGFPTGDYNTMLYSQWMCGAVDTLGNGCGIGPSFTGLFGMGSGGSMFCGNKTYSGPGTFYNGTFAGPPNGVRHHYLLSVNALTQVVQLYIDDQPIAVTGTWTAPPGSTPFNIGFTSSTYWIWNNEGTLFAATRPGIGDVFVCNLPGDTWVDLSVAANRRKFINADLTPVYLGANGATPFGTQPQIYCTIPAGSTNASDILTNRGMGGANFAADQTAPTFQAPGTCTLPVPPAGTLAMDNVVCTATAALLQQNLISLRWSDDRGHTWGSPVTQDIGEVGEYRTSLQWQRCGLARDRVWELSWSVPMKTALQGAWIDVTPASS
jgi:hypothetical protein